MNNAAIGALRTVTLCLFTMIYSDVLFSTMSSIPAVIIERHLADVCQTHDVLDPQMRTNISAIDGTLVESAAEARSVLSREKFRCSVLKNLTALSIIWTTINCRRRRRFYSSPSLLRID